MNPESLNKFLATVRRTRFIDYLDPIGVTAQEAIHRRLRSAAKAEDEASEQRLSAAIGDVEVAKRPPVASLVIKRVRLSPATLSHRARQQGHGRARPRGRAACSATWERASGQQQF